MGGGAIIRGIGLGVLAMALTVGAAFLWVWFYASSINPGHDGAFYQLYAQRVAPLAAILVGVPLLFVAGWLNGRGQRSWLAALVPAATYILLDAVLIAASGLWPPLWTLAVSYLTKTGAAWAGGRLARRQGRSA